MTTKIISIIFLATLCNLSTSQIYSIQAQKEDFVTPLNYAPEYQFYVPTQEAFNRYKRQIFSTWFLSRPPVTMGGQTYQNSGSVPSLSDLINVALQSIGGNQQDSNVFGSYPQSNRPFQGLGGQNYPQNPLMNQFPQQGGAGNFISNPGSYARPQGIDPTYQNGYPNYQNGPGGIFGGQNEGVPSSSNGMLAGPGAYPSQNGPNYNGQYGLVPNIGSVGGSINGQLSLPFLNGPSGQFSAIGQIGTTTSAPTGPFGGFFQRLVGGGRSLGTSRDTSSTNSLGRSLGSTSNNSSSSRSKRAVKTIKVPDEEHPGMKKIFIQLYQKN